MNHNASSKERQSLRHRIQVAPLITSWELSKLVTNIPRSCLTGSRRSVLRTLADHYPQIYLGVPKMAEESGCGTTTVREALGDLLSGEWITAGGNRKGGPGAGFTEQYFINVPKIRQAASKPTDSVALLAANPTDSVLKATDSGDEHISNRESKEVQNTCAHSRTIALEPFFEQREPVTPEGIEGIVYERLKMPQRRCDLGWCDQMHPAPLPCQECGEIHGYVHTEEEWNRMLDELFEIEPSHWIDHQEWEGQRDHLIDCSVHDALARDDASYGCGCGYWTFDYCDRHKPLTWRHAESAAAFFNQVYHTFKRFTPKEEIALMELLATAVGTNVVEKHKIAYSLWPIGRMSHGDGVRAEILVSSNLEAGQLVELIRPKVGLLRPDLERMGMQSLYLRGRQRSYHRFPVAEREQLQLQAQA